MAITTAAGLSVTTVSTTQQAPLGFELTVPTANQGEQVWIYVQANAPGPGLVAGTVCARGAGAAAATFDVIPAPVTTGVNGVVGVCVTAIPDNSFGFIMKKGFCNVLAGSGTIDVDEAIIVGATTAGRADAVAGGGAGAAVQIGFGWATANAAAGNPALCYIHCT